MDDQGSTSDERSRRVDTAFMVLACAFAIGFTVWLTWGVWHAGLPSGGDTAAHAVRADNAFSWFFPRFEIDGWQTRFALGYQQSLFIGPGFGVMIGLVRALSFGSLSSLDAFKVTGVVSMAVVPIGVAFVALSFGLGRRAAGVAAVLSLTVSSQFGGAGIAGTYIVGLWSNQAVTLPWLLAFGGIVRIVRRPTRRRVVWTALATALVLATHPVGTVILAVMSMALVIGAAVEAAGLGRGPLGRSASPIWSGVARWWSWVGHAARRRVVALAGAAGLAVGLAAFQMIPVLAHRDLIGSSADWPDPNLILRLGDIWRGAFLFRPWVPAIVLAGMAYGLVVCRRRRLLLTLVLTPAIFLVLGRIAINLAPKDQVAIQLTNRAFAYVGLLAVLPLALAIATLTQSKPAEVTDPVDPSGSTFRQTAGGVVAALPAFLVAFVIVWLPGHLDRGFVHTVKPNPAFADAATALHELVPETGRFAMVWTPADEWPLTGVDHANAWIGWASGRDTLGIFNIESSVVRDPLFSADGLLDVDPNSSDQVARADGLSRLGITHVLVINRQRSTKVTASPRYHEVWQEGPMSIYEVVPPAGQPSPADLISGDPGVDLQAQARRNGPEHVDIDVTAAADTTATVAIAWSPKWHATIDGRTVPLHKSEGGILALSVPAGESHLQLRFGSDQWDALGRLVSLLSLALAVALLVQDRRVRLREAAQPPGGAAREMTSR